VNNEVMIFSTSDIFTNLRNRPSGRIVAENRDGVYVSTEKLEAAVNSGFRCYVASTRERLTDGDSWWVEIVGRDNVFLAEEPEYYCDYGPSQDRNACVSKGYTDLAAHLGAAWPTDKWDGRPAFWPSGMPKVAEAQGWTMAKSWEGPIELPKAVRQVAKHLQVFAKATVLLVGGAVVDALQGRTPKDWDLEVYGVAPPDVIEVLDRHGWKPQAVGNAFGVVKLAHDATDGVSIDISFPKADNTRDGETDFGPVDIYMTPAEAALRRDLTINSLMYDIEARKVIDSHGGLDDLRDGVLRATSPEHYAQDPIRPLRAMQLAARKVPNVDPLTMALLRSMATDEAFASLAIERVGEEFHKLMMAEKPSIGLEVLRESGWLRFFPELEALVGCPQNPDHHPEGPVWDHTMLVVDAMSSLARTGTSWTEEPLDGLRRKALMFAALCHDLGKPVTVQDDLSCPKHDVEGEELVRSFLGRLTNETVLTEAVVALSRNHMRPFGLVDGKARESRWGRLKADLVKHPKLKNGGLPSLEDAGYLSRADWMGSRPVGTRFANGSTTETDRDHHEIAERCWEMHRELEKAEPLVGGRDLIKAGVKPGPQMGKLVKAAYVIQLDEPELALEELIARVMS